MSDLFIQYQAQQVAAQSEKGKDKEKEKEKRKRAKSDPKRPPPLKEIKRSSFLKSSTSGSIGAVFKEQLNE